MNKALLVSAIASVLFLSSCENRRPPEQEENESAIRENHMKEDAQERKKQKSDIKAVIEDSLRQKKFDLSLFRQQLAQDQSNLEDVKKEMRKIGGDGPNKEKLKDDATFKLFSLRISSLEEEIDTKTGKINQLQQDIEKLETDLQNMN